MRCSLSLRERDRVRGKETQSTETAGRILQAQLDRLAESGLAITSSAEPVDGGSARGRKRIGVSSVASPSPRPSPLGRGWTPGRLLKSSVTVTIRSPAAGDETAVIRFARLLQPTDELGERPPSPRPSAPEREWLRLSRNVFHPWLNRF